MAKPRKRKASKTTQPKRVAAKSGKPKASSSRRRAAAPIGDIPTSGAEERRREEKKRRPRPASKAEAEADEDIYIPRDFVFPDPLAGRIPTTFTHTNKRFPLVRAEEDVDVFVARAGPPVEIQTDLEDEETPYIPVDLRDMVEAMPGWTYAELREHGLAVERGHVVCAYGCPGGQSKIVGLSWHTSMCQFWHSPEGQNKTPF